MTNCFNRRIFKKGVLLLFGLFLLSVSLNCFIPGCQEESFMRNLEEAENLTEHITGDLDFRNAEIYNPDYPYDIIERQDFEGNNYYDLFVEYRFFNGEAPEKDEETMRAYSNLLQEEYINRNIVNLRFIEVFWEDEVNNRTLSFFYEYDYDKHEFDLKEVNEYYYQEDEL